MIIYSKTKRDESFFSAWLEINLDNLKRNFLTIKKFVGDKKIISVVKANAYGHGALMVAKELEQLGTDMLAVANVEEGIELRKGGINKPILIFGFIFPEEINLLMDFSLTPTIYSETLAKELNKQVEKRKEKIKIHIKIDTGMARVGIAWNESLGFIKRIKALKGLEIEGLYSHFSSADEKNSAFSEIQFRRFKKVIEQLNKEKINIPIKHMSNSAALLNFPQFNLDAVRPGILLYGLNPLPEKLEFKIYPVMALKTRVIFMKEIKAGVSVGYGRTFYAKRPSLIATVPFGYADGYPRTLSNKGEVLVKGRRAGIVGRICMDSLMIDVTDIKNPKEGDEVVVIGKSGKEEITVEELANLCQTINYEIACGIKERVKRLYIKNGKSRKE